MNTTFLSISEFKKLVNASFNISNCKTQSIAKVLLDEDSTESYPYYFPVPTDISEREFKIQLIRENLECQDYIYLVTRNSDFIEGRGHMIPMTSFRKKFDAEEFIKSQKGISTTSPNRRIVYGININHELYVYISYNGFSIEKIKLN